jgi:type I restriction enzyme S subunit
MKHSDWTTTTLGEIASFKSGSTPSKQNEEFWGGQHPWISAKDLKTHYLSTSIDTLTDKGFTESKRAPLGSSLVLVRGMTLLKDFPVGYASIELAFNQDIKALVPKPGIDPLFLSYLLVSKKDFFLQNVSVAGHGTGKLETEILKELPVVIPPTTEQTKIAQVLSTWDKAIATTERLLANSQQQKQSLLQQLLTGKKRFVGFSGTWYTRKLSEISTRIQRKSDGEEHPILTISSLSGFVSREEKYSRYMAGESVNNYIQLNQGEFAYNKGNSKTYQYGCVFKLDSFATGLVPHVYVCFKLNQGFDPCYYSHLFAADYLKDQLAGLVNTGVRNNGLLNIKPSAFLDTTVPVPPLAEQQKIAKVPLHR